MQGEVEAIELIDTIENDFHHMRVQIDFDYYHLFDNYNEICKLLNKQVTFRYRYDIINSSKEKVLCELAQFHVVQTLDKTSGIKLIPANRSGNACCNFDIRDLRVGDIQYGAIFILSDYTFEKSNKACWVDMSMIDKSSHQFNIRMFLDNDQELINNTLSTIKEMIGKYVLCHVMLNKFGYNTQEITLYNVPVVAQQEVEIAFNMLNEYVVTDTELNEYVSNYNMLDYLKTIVSGEVGYQLVSMAMECMIIDTLGDMSYDFDIKVLKRAVFCSRGYLLPNKTKLSKVVVNITQVLRTSLKKDKELLNILDPLSIEDVSYNKWMYLEISKFVSSIIEARRGTLDTSYTSGVFDSLRKQFNNLI